MASQEINLELLLGRKVLALNGKSIGRLEEVRGELSPGECHVTEFLVGDYAVFERLSAWSIARSFLSLFGPLIKSGYRVPWDKLDLSDPKHPKLTCKVAVLPPLEIKVNSHG
jgi:sporulation protein YlmC with PRC-barrel domain